MLFLSMAAFATYFQIKQKDALNNESQPQEE